MIVLDGGLATELEHRGHDLSSDLWSARLLAEQPDEISAVHAAYFSAGARVATTASYQASYEGLAAVGHSPAAADALLRRSVTLAREAAAEARAATRRRSALGRGLRGAVRRDARRRPGVHRATTAPPSASSELRAWHRPRLEVLASAEPDVLALETIPSLAEAEALLPEVGRPRAPRLAVLDLRGTGRGAARMPAEAFAMARDVDAIVAVGVNCTRPQDVAPLAELARVSGKPVVVYPNSGETWDGTARVWTRHPGFAPDDVVRWVDCGRPARRWLLPRRTGRDPSCRAGGTHDARRSADRSTGGRASPVVAPGGEEGPEQHDGRADEGHGATDSSRKTTPRGSTTAGSGR